VSGSDDEATFAVITTVLPCGTVEMLLVGEIDLLTAPRVVATAKGELDRFASGAAVHVDVVLNAVTFADSSGILALLDVRDAVLARHGQLRLVSPSDAVRFVLELTGLDKAFDIV
jgi:anti-sigma B factor antagonist